MIEYLIFS